MRRWARPGILAVLACIGFRDPTPLAAQAGAGDLHEGLALSLGGWIQPRLEMEEGADGEWTSRMVIRRARLDLRGRVVAPDLSFRLQADIAKGGRLRDAWVAWTPVSAVSVRIGQQSLPFAFQVSPRRRQFPEASLLLDSPESRDVGIVLEGRAGEVLSYEAGLFDGSGGGTESGSGTGHLASARVHVALVGALPREETDLVRTAPFASAVGVGLQRGSRSQMELWPAALTGQHAVPVPNDWVSVVGDVQLQHRGAAVQAAYSERRRDAGVEPNPATGRSWMAAAGYVLGTPVPIELAIRHSAVEVQRAGLLGRGELTEAVASIFHMGHSLKSRFGVFDRQEGSDRQNRASRGATSPVLGERRPHARDRRVAVGSVPGRSRPGEWSCRRSSGSHMSSWSCSERRGIRGQGCAPDSTDPRILWSADPAQSTRSPRSAPCHFERAAPCHFERAAPVIPNVRPPVIPSEVESLP